MYEDIIPSLQTLIKEFLNNQGFILVDLSLHFQAGKLTLRILTDHPRGGISLDECAYLNEKISKLLDEKDLIKQSYILEVSSPGADRPLKTEEDFRRCIDRKVVVYTKEPIKGKIENIGRIRDVKEGIVFLEIEEEILEIPYIKINKAKQIIQIEG